MVIHSKLTSAREFIMEELAGYESFLEIMFAINVAIGLWSGLVGGLFGQWRDGLKEKIDSEEGMSFIFSENREVGAIDKRFRERHAERRREALRTVFTSAQKWPPHFGKLVAIYILVLLWCMGSACQAVCYLPMMLSANIVTTIVLFPPIVLFLWIAIPSSYLRIRSYCTLRKHKRDMQVLDKYGDEMIKSGEDIL